MSYFLQYVHFLEHLFFWKLVLHIAFVYRFYRHLFASKFMNAKSYLAESSFTNEFHEFVVF